MQMLKISCILILIFDSIILILTFNGSNNKTTANHLIFKAQSMIMTYLSTPVNNFLI